MNKLTKGYAALEGTVRRNSVEQSRNRTPESVLQATLDLPDGFSYPLLFGEQSESYITNAISDKKVTVYGYFKPQGELVNGLPLNGLYVSMIVVKS